MENRGEVCCLFWEMGLIDWFYWQNIVWTLGFGICCLTCIYLFYEFRCVCSWIFNLTKQSVCVCFSWEREKEIEMKSAFHLTSSIRVPLVTVRKKYQWLGKYAKVGRVWTWFFMLIVNETFFFSRMLYFRSRFEINWNELQIYCWFNQLKLNYSSGCTKFAVGNFK